ncbi:MAG TPA: hypothetical protein VEC35_25645 [Noviherbaspirillum sp.]|nr:hypothetical protein [Noviherbaspirillum sp.]
MAESVGGNTNEMKGELDNIKDDTWEKQLILAKFQSEMEMNSAVFKFMQRAAESINR